MNKEFPLVPVHGQAGCAGHLLRSAKGFRAFDTDSKELGTFKDAALAAHALLDQQSNGEMKSD
jgi:hypothetical protein